MRLIPREEKFFDHFCKSADLIVEGTKEFRDLLNDLDHADSRARNIKFIESRADEVTHQTVELLHRTFITPIDRGDIYRLITKLDDILDTVEAASQRVQVYQIKSAPKHMKELTELCVNAAEDVRKAVKNLSELKKPGEILKHCIEVNRWENEADHILRGALASLFQDEQDIRLLIKLKEIYELLESVTDRCEDVANVVEGIVLEYA
jgi:uncharacterized protein